MTTALRRTSAGTTTTTLTARDGAPARTARRRTLDRLIAELNRGAGTFRPIA